MRDPAVRARSPGMLGRSGQRSPSRAAIGLVLAAILLLATLWVTGAFNSATHSATHASAAAHSLQRSHHPAFEPKPPRRRPVVPDNLGSHRVFAGRAFSIAYPRGWSVTAAEAPAPWGTDTTITAPGDPHTMIRVDVVTHPAAGDPSTVAEPVIAGVAGQPGYRPLGLINGSFDRRPAALWTFLVAEAGVMLQKQDVFFAPHPGTVIALLTSAPANAYPRLATRFTAIRRSLVAH